MRTYRTLASAGIATVQDVEVSSWEQLVELLDAGGYVRYDYRMASRLQALAHVVQDRLQGRVESLASLANPLDLEGALDSLPGWGPVTVRLFLRELRGVWPGAEPEPDPAGCGVGPRSRAAGRGGGRGLAGVSRQHGRRRRA